MSETEASLGAVRWVQRDCRGSQNQDQGRRGSAPADPCPPIAGLKVEVTCASTKSGRLVSPYYWSRVATAVGRSSRYVPGKLATWHLLVSDDFHLESGGGEYRAALVAFMLLCLTVNVLLSWNKTAGGDAVTCTGRISERRAASFTR